MGDEKLLYDRRETDRRFTEQASHIKTLFKKLEGNGSEGVIERIARLEEREKSMNEDLKSIKESQRSSMLWQRATLASMVIGFVMLLARSYLGL